MRISEDARARNAAAAEALSALLEDGVPMYGVTTGVGALRSRGVPPGERTDNQLRLLRSHAGGAGKPVPVELVRAAMAVRANQLGAGGAGVSDALLDLLVAALNAGLVPFARELGSLGTGDLSVLAEIVLSPSLAKAGCGGARSCWRRAVRWPTRGWPPPASGLATGWP